MALWPELSHSDTLMLEYFVKNSWNPKMHSVNELIGEFSASRYGDDAAQMQEIWDTFVPLYYAPRNCYMETFFNLLAKDKLMTWLLDKNHKTNAAFISLFHMCDTCF